MRFVFFVHSLVSCWNHGNAHFLRGLVRALEARGHTVVSAERRGGWSFENLLREEGPGPILEFARAFPRHRVVFYEGGERLEAQVGALLEGADVAVVHEWNEPELAAAASAIRARRRDLVLLFHDTHHRLFTAPEEMARFDLTRFDGVLSFGRVLAEAYLARTGARRAFTFHEAADVELFRPLASEKRWDVLWIGNWGDEERTRELHEYLLGTARQLRGLRFAAYGVRYPAEAREALAAAGVRYLGWVPSARVPEALASARITLHIPRRCYVDLLPGVPTIRPFEALACGVPLVSAPFRDVEGLFRVGRDCLVVHSPAEMRDAVERLARDADARTALAESGLTTIRDRHTCAHRAAQLERIVASIRAESPLSTVGVAPWSVR